MMQVEYKLNLGGDEFTLKAEVENAIEFFEKMSFYSSLPKTGPNGETDLKLTHRTTKEGYNYYSLVSEKAGMEFQFGVLNGKGLGGLYPKGWAPIFGRQGGAEASSTEATTTQAEAAPAPRANVATNDLLSRGSSAKTTSAPKASAKTAKAETAPVAAADIISKYAAVPSAQKTEAPAAQSSSVNALLRR